MSNKSPVGRASHFANIGSSKAGSHTSNSLLLKSQSGQLFTVLQQSHSTTESQSVYCNNSLDHNSVTRPSASLHVTGFFCSCNEGMGMMPPWFNAEMAEGTAANRNLKLLTGWMLGIPTRNSGNGFLKQTCTTNLPSAVRHILRTSAAERLAAKRPTHCCWKLNLDNCSLVCSSHIAQLRAQSLYCNKSRRPQLRDQTLCFSAYDRFFLQLQRRDGHDATMI